MPSASPSPVKRPSLVERNSSNHSLSSSGKQTTTTPHKTHRPHVVNRHSRNVSHGKNLTKLNRVNSGPNINQAQNHQRKRSGASATATTPSQSPKAPGPPKRNSSHVTLTKNTSLGNLRKNHSANALARNTSHPALKKLGLPPAPPAKEDGKKAGFFQLGDQSSGDEDEAEWEDSTTQSPEFTRDNSKVSTPARVATPNGERIQGKPPDVLLPRPKRTSSPPQPSIRNSNRSLPDIIHHSNISPSHVPQDPALLNNNGRASRAPPAMSTISAHAAPIALNKSDSNRSFTHITHSEAASINLTPATTAAGASSSGDGTVSHFLTPATPGSLATSTSKTPVTDEDSDDDSVSDFMSNYRPQPSESPDKSRSLHKARLPHVPSRTQQKLELQRRETMRAAGGAPATPPTPGMGLSAGSSISLHSRSGSRGRNRSLAEEIKALKHDYEVGVKQLTVVRRFRNPVLESLNRLKDNGILPADIGVVTPSGAASKSRPQSRRGVSNAASSTNLALTASNTTANSASSKGGLGSGAGVSRSFEDRKSAAAPRAGSRVHFGPPQPQRQGSHDDIGITPSATAGLVGAPGAGDYDDEDEDDGFSPEEALLRRIWESRDVYDREGEPGVTVGGDGGGR